MIGYRFSRFAFGSENTILRDPSLVDLSQRNDRSIPSFMGDLKRKFGDDSEIVGGRERPPALPAKNQQPPLRDLE
ncbi:unnamed protein product [Linum tenue]|uniref:Uncharacterized protein n=1 Tax=Linum tenue TaxID=586396 RepID=A0AAV0QYF1_9ROSI|nr:unnamed protein product [Linum tenue]